MQVESDELSRRGCFLDVPYASFLKRMINERSSGTQNSNIFGKIKESGVCSGSQRPNKIHNTRDIFNTTSHDVEGGFINLSCNGGLTVKIGIMDVSEFSRLLFVLRDEESLCEAWKKSNQPLKKGIECENPE